MPWGGTKQERTNMRMTKHLSQKTLNPCMAEDIPPE